MIDGIKYHIDKGEAVIRTYLDLKKTFDTVNHGILCAKLEHYGVRGMSLNFFQSYLGNRKQFVSCNNTSSYTTTNRYGVPQGSVLGPLLFLIDINDIVNAVNGLKIRLFADDTALYVHGKDIGRIFNQMRDDLSKLKEWFACNRLTLNFLNTCYNIYHGPRRTISRMHDRMNIGGHSIFAKNVKYLGLIESIKTTSMEDVSTRGLEKIKNI